MAGHMGNKNCTKFAVRVSVSIFTDTSVNSIKTKTPVKTFVKIFEYSNLISCKEKKNRSTKIGCLRGKTYLQCII